MKNLCLALLVFGVLWGSGLAQKKMKPWTEWSLKEAQKILNDSAWGQTQTETNTAEMFYAPGSKTQQTTRERPIRQRASMIVSGYFRRARFDRRSPARSSCSKKT